VIRCRKHRRRTGVVRSILDIDPDHAGIKYRIYGLGDLGRGAAVSRLNVRADRQINRAGNGGDFGYHRVAANLLAIRNAARRGDTAARRADCRKPCEFKHARTRGIPGARQQQAPAVVQLAEANGAPSVFLV
jgi:hypothetical protein